jgi:electron transfer flavoprotein alpha/beta subunit
MNILVCIKQVPDTTAIKIDPVKHTLIRDGVPSIVNTFDAYALEVACRMKDNDPDTTITVLSMGPAQAMAALKECVSKGADAAYLVTDRAFGGSDTLATSYILSQSIKQVEEKMGKVFDLVLCGKQAIDGDTGQVGPELSEHLGRGLITYASDVVVENGEFIAKRESDQGYDRLAVSAPAVITVVKPAYKTRYPSIRGLQKAREMEIVSITAADLPLDLEQCGLKGSPTKVRKTFTPTHEKNGLRIENERGADAAAKLVSLLADAKLL